MPGSQTQESYDLVFIDDLEPEGYGRVGVMLARPPKTSGQTASIEQVFEPTELGQVSPPRPVPIIWDDWRAGGGVAKPVDGVSAAYAVGRNACTRFGSVTPAGALHEMDLSHLPAHGRITRMFVTRGHVLCLTSSQYPFLILDGSGPIVLGTADLAPGTVLGDAAILQNQVYIACEAGPMVKWDNTGVWTQADESITRARIASVTWTRGGVPRRRLVATNATSTAFVYTTGDDPMNPAHWSSEVPIESTWPVQELIAGPRHVYATGPGGVFDLTETGETPCITGDTWANNYHPSNGASGVLYDNRLYYGGVNGTFAISLEGVLVDAMEDVSISRLRPGDLPVGGRPSPLLVVDGWLTQFTYSAPTQTSQLWYGMRPERYGVQAPWPMLWHGSECDVVGLSVNWHCVVAPPTGPRRMYLACTDAATGASRLFWHELPKYGSPLADYAFQQPDRMHYARDWSVTQTEEVLGDPASTKTPLWWDLVGQNLGGPNRLTVAVAGRDGAYVTQGTATTDDVRFGAQAVADKGLSVRTTGANSEDVPSVLHAVKGSWVVTVEESATAVLPVIFGQGVDLVHGGEDTQDGDLTFALLLRMTERQSVRCIRWDGAEVRVRLEQGMRRRWQESPDGQGWLDGAIITMTTLTRPLYHDVGDLHDIGLRHDG